MMWTSVDDGLPTPFVKVWVLTDTGRQTTAYIRSDGTWNFLCPKFAAQQPAVVKWRG